MVQQVKSARTDNLVLIPRTHTAEGENQPPKMSFYFHVCIVPCVYTHMYMHTDNKCKILQRTKTAHKQRQTPLSAYGWSYSQWQSIYELRMCRTQGSASSTGEEMTPLQLDPATLRTVTALTCDRCRTLPSRSPFLFFSHIHTVTLPEIPVSVA